MNAANSAISDSASAWTVYGKPVHSSESMSASADETRMGAPFSQAPDPFSAVKSSFRLRIVNRRDDGLSVVLERARAAENRQPVRVVGGAVDGIEDPGVLGGALPVAARREFFREDLVAGKTLPNKRAEHRLDVAVDLGD